MTPGEFREFIIHEQVPPIPKVVLLTIAGRIERRLEPRHPSLRGSIGAVLLLSQCS